VGIGLGSNFTIATFGEVTSMSEVPPPPQNTNNLPDLRIVNEEKLLDELDSDGDVVVKRRKVFSLLT
jgi:hypothetical protein